MKSKVYFWVAQYFRFFAKLVLKRWKPRIIVVTGSAGKTTALTILNTLISQKYSVRKSSRANSAIGVPLDILGLHLTNYTKKEWLTTIFMVPVRAFWGLIEARKEKYYLVELDVDRPGEMTFFANFIKPRIIFWVSSYATHTENFESRKVTEATETIQEVVANEFAQILTSAHKNTLLIMNGDSLLMTKAARLYRYKKVVIKKKSGVYSFLNWQLYRKRTEFSIRFGKQKSLVTIPQMVPENFGYTLLALYAVAKELNIEERLVKITLDTYTPLPGRSSIFKGADDITLIDSTYNSSYYATSSLLTMLEEFPGKRKIAVLGDMRELGSESESEHRRLAVRIIECHVDQVVLVGPQMKAYMYPYLLEHGYSDTNAHFFENTYQAGLFIKERLAKPGDIILLKASQNTLFFELIVEMLLEDKSEVSKLCRREKIWEDKRSAIKKDFYDSLNAKSLKV